MKKEQPGKHRTAEIDNLKRQFTRARISLGDIEEAIDYLAAFNDSQPSAIRRSILLAAIVSYCRPFFQNAIGSKSESTSLYKFHTKDLFNLDDWGLHNLLLDLRRKVLAHSDFDEKPVTIDHVGRHGYSTSLRVFDLLSETIKPNDILGLCVKVKEDCKNKMFALSQLLKDAILASNTLSIDGINGLIAETTADFSLLIPRAFRFTARNASKHSVEVNLSTGKTISSNELKE